MSALAAASAWVIPALLAVVLVAALIRKVPAFEAFVEGGKEGLKLTANLLPFLLGMMAAVAVFRASGAMDWVTQLLRPALSALRIPADIVPMALIRPLSGTASLAMAGSLTTQFGPDSQIGRLAAVMQGGTDTTVYILTVYFGAVGIKKMGHALAVGLLADFIAFALALVVVAAAFGG